MLIGGAGADVLDGGEGMDTVSYTESIAGVTVNLRTGEGSGGYATEDRIRGVEQVSGSEHADALTGDDGDNVLEGNGGADTLDGGAGVIPFPMQVARGRPGEPAQWCSLWGTCDRGQYPGFREHYRQRARGYPER